MVTRKPLEYLGLIEWETVRRAPNFTEFPAARNFGWISPSLVNLRKVAVITVSQLVAGTVNGRCRGSYYRCIC